MHAPPSLPRRVQCVFGHFCDISFRIASMSRSELPAHSDHLNAPIPFLERVWSILEDNSSLTPAAAALCLHHAADQEHAAVDNYRRTRTDSEIIPRKKTRHRLSTEKILRHHNHCTHMSMYVHMCKLLHTDVQKAVVARQSCDFDCAETLLCRFIFFNSDPTY